MDLDGSGAWLLPPPVCRHFLQGECSRALELSRGRMELHDTNGTSRVPPVREAAGACRRPLDESSGAPQAPHAYLQAKARGRTQQNSARSTVKGKAEVRLGWSVRSKPPTWTKLDQQQPGTRGSSPQQPDHPSPESRGLIVQTPRCHLRSGWRISDVLTVFM